MTKTVPDDEDTDEGLDVDDRLLEALVTAAACALKIEGDDDAAAAGGEDGEIGDDSDRCRGAPCTKEVPPFVVHELRFHARRLVPGQWRPPNYDGIREEKEHNEEDDGVDVLAGLLVAKAVDIARQRLRAHLLVDDAANANANQQSKKPRAETATAPIPAPAPTAMSFSLLDQFNAQLLGAGGLGLVTAEQILEAETLVDQLALLQQVQELDEQDWLGDCCWGGDSSDSTSPPDAGGGSNWERVLDAIRRGITAPYEEPPPSGGGQADVAMDYARLLERWIDMAGSRNGNAFGGGGGGGAVGVLQLDLVQLALDVLASDAVPPTKRSLGSTETSAQPTEKARTTSSSPESPHVECDIMTSLLRCVWRTWMDWMMQAESRIGVGNEARIQAIGAKLWTLASPPPGRDQTTSSLRPSLLASLDPCALWFSSWMSLRAGYPTKDALDGLVGSCDTSKLTNATIEERDSISPLSLAFRQLRDIEADMTAGKGGVVPSFCCYWLSIVHSLLSHLRVSHFPWRVLMVHDVGDKNTALAQDEAGRTITWLINVYLLVLNRLHSPTRGRIPECESDVDRESLDLIVESASAWKLRMRESCLDAVSILLSGCRNRGCCSNVIRLVHDAAADAGANPALRVLGSSLHVTQE